MPLLKREADSYPDDIFRVPLEEAPWWVLHVKSRQEKSVARFMMESRLSFYLPQIEKTVRKNGRILKSYIPLFGGYIFHRGDKEGHSSLYRNHSIVRTITVENQQQLHVELRQLWDLQRSGATLVPHPFISVGDDVRITAGVFAGYRGSVVREKGRSLLIVSVSVIHHSIAVELERDAVVPMAAVAR
jgi:transcription termination/antitermination protein NusG